VLLLGTFASVQVPLEKEPALAVHETLPVGFDGLPLPVSVTVAVQLDAPPMTIDEGTQLTLVVVERP
jgi:hypothetical protein